jgi:type IV secretion system protein VirB2
MQLAEQRSLFDTGGDAPIMQSVQWIERVMLGDVALGLCVIAVAVVGAVMLGGRLPVKEGLRIVVGLFVVLGAPVIGGGFAARLGEAREVLPANLSKLEDGTVRDDLPLADRDPYAGASLGDQ